jgi:NADH-quinone oxidoreductase subunit L
LLGRAMAGDGNYYYVLYVMVVVGAFCTAFYTFRMVFLTFFGQNRASEEVQHHIHESPFVMTFPLIVLAILSLLGGVLLGGGYIPHMDGYIAGGPGLYNVMAEEHALHKAHTVNLIVTAVAAAAGIALAMLRYAAGANIPNPEAAKSNVPYKLSLNKFYVDEIYNWTIIVPFRIFSELTHWIVELLIIDLFVTGTAYAVSGISGLMRRMQTGLINTYAAGVVLGLFLLYYLLRP